MGQYHTIISLTAGEYLDAHDFGSGVKLLEMACSTGGVLEAFVQKLQHDWKGHRVAIVGDYYKKDDLSPEALVNIDSTSPYARNIYEYAEYEFENGKSLIPFINKNHDAHVIMNYTKNQFVSPEGYGDAVDPAVFARHGDSGGVTSVLAVLLAASCKGGARGGGDIDSESFFVGSWAGDSIAVVPAGEVPADAVNIDAEMRRVMQDAGETTYGDVDGQIGRSVWDYTRNCHGVISL